MGTNKYETQVLPNLEKILRWAQQGATIKDIAQKAGVSYSTLHKYVKRGRAGDERYAALAEAFPQACAVADDEIETALFRRARGYRYTEVTRGQRLDKEGNIVTLEKTVEKDVPPDTASAMFWLTNRRPDRWRYKPQRGDGGDGDTAGGVVLIPGVEESRE